MGGRTRYQPFYDAACEAKHRDEVVRRGEPVQSLTDAEIQRGEVPVTRAPEPLPVAAWVRYGASPILVNAFTITWTSRAVEIIWRTPAGETRRAWVWASAVRRRELTSEESSAPAQS